MEYGHPLQLTNRKCHLCNVFLFARSDCVVLHIITLTFWLDNANRLRATRFDISMAIAITIIIINPSEFRTITHNTQQNTTPTHIPNWEQRTARERCCVHRVHTSIRPNQAKRATIPNRICVCLWVYVGATSGWLHNHKRSQCREWFRDARTSIWSIQTRDGQSKTHSHTLNECVECACKICEFHFFFVCIVFGTAVRIRDDDYNDDDDDNMRNVCCVLVCPSVCDKIVCRIERQMKPTNAPMKCYSSMYAAGAQPRMAATFCRHECYARSEYVNKYSTWAA